MSVMFNDVLKEINRLNARSPEGWSAAEMADATGMGIQKCREHIKRLIKEGVVRHNGRARRESIDDLMRSVPVYVYVKKGVKREK